MHSARIMAAALLVSGQAAPATAAGSMTFDDEFTAFVSSPDGSVGWMTTYPYSGEASRTLSGNNEAEYYSDSSVGVNPFSVNNGVLSIVAAPASSGSNPYNLPYTSGLITTFGSFSQLYGVFKVRAKLPAGQGLWPAFWLLPASDIYTSELDVFEVLGQVPTTLYATTHGSTGGVWGSDFQTVQVADTSQHFHVYSVDWEPLTTNFSIDGQVIATAITPASMNTPMYMLLNLAVGGAGSWPGPPNASTHFPASMLIDWVRAFTSPNTQSVAGRAALLRSGAPPIQ